MGETPNATSLIVMKTRIHQATFSPINDLISWYELLALNVEGKDNSFLYLQIKRGNEMLWLLYLDEYFDQFNCKARSIQFIRSSQNSTNLIADSGNDSTQFITLHTRSGNFYTEWFSLLKVCVLAFWRRCTVWKALEIIYPYMNVII